VLAFLRTLQLPEGVAGTQRTLEAMRELTAAAQLDPIVRSFALQLWRGAGERPYETASLVRRFIRSRVGFVLEPVEMLHRPEWMLRQVAAGGRPYGDCDDMAMIAGALLTALGIPVRFAAVKPAGDDDYIHVYAEMFDGGTWYVVDPTASQVPPGTWDVLRVEV
jgi:transglutaminase-like putative cysteine protease